MQEGRYTSITAHCVRSVLTQLTRSHYTLDELKQQPPPDGVDPSRMEDYLTDKDFEKILGVTRREFLALQQWKQLELKKKAELF